MALSAPSANASRAGDLVEAPHGAGLYLAFSAVPILVYAWWAATPGTHAGPFEWSMTLPAWQLWLSITAIYLAAFLVGMRPARWIGSRLLPLVAVGLFVLLLQISHPLVVAVRGGSAGCAQRNARGLHPLCGPDT